MAKRRRLNKRLDAPRVSARPQGVGEMTALDPHSIVSVMGGAVTGRNSCSVPGPGHSKADKSLSIRIDPADPLGFKVHSFAGDDWQTCRDYVAATLGLEHKGGGLAEWQVLEASMNSWKLTSANRPNSGNYPKSEYPLQLWSEAISARVSPRLCAG